MKLFDKVAGLFGYSKISAATQRDKTGWFVEWANGGAATVSGERVNNNTAMQLPVVFACIKAISEDIAKVPLKVFRADADRREPQPTHQLQRLLQVAPNPDMTAITFRQTLTAHCLGWGNGYAEIQRDLGGNVVGLYPLSPDKVRVFRLDDGQIWYEVTGDDAARRWVRFDWMLHVPGLGFDGLVGYNVIHYARESLGAAMATQKTAAGFFGNSMSPDGILTHQNTLSAEAQERLRATMAARHGGAHNAKKMMILEEGMTYTPTMIPPEEAQFLETRQFTIPEICRWFRMPPHKVADLSRATFSNIEHQALEYVGDTLTPWMTRWEQEIARKLFTPVEAAEGFYVKHIAEGLLRGDIATRYSAYATARQWGWMSADDVRQLEDMNPLDEGGDIYLTPANMTDVTSEEPQETIQPENPFAADIADRIAGAEIRMIERRMEKSTDKRQFDKWLIKYFNTDHESLVRKALIPLGVNAEPIVEQLALEGIDAFTSNPNDAMRAWKESRANGIYILIQESLKCVSTVQ